MKKLLLIILLISMFFVFGCQENRMYLCEGIYERTEYKMGGFGSSDRTVIYFKDGETCVLRNMWNINYKKGDRIVVYAIKSFHSETVVYEIVKEEN